MKVLPRDFNRYVTFSMFTSGVSEPCKTLKKAILERGDLTYRQRSGQVFNNIDLQHCPTADMSLRSRELTGQWIFDEGLFRQLFLSELHQSVQTVLVSLKNNSVDKLAESVNQILEITITPSLKIYSVKEILKQYKMMFQISVTL